LRAARCWDEIQDTLETDEKGVIAATIATHLKSSDLAIDFGCGGGRYLCTLARNCTSVIGIDISRRVGRARRTLSFFGDIMAFDP
jgi:2-polyprenyl-3-methyl-5-hydroxy-6-metoxy-1,4-benzoquinol methylase